MLKIVILIPAYNEEKTIRDVIESIPIIEGFTNKIIVIDDGSTDNTAKEVKKTNVKLISNTKNYGLGFTFRKGLSEAIKEEADIIINLDADGQYDSKDILILLRKFLRDDLDLVIGSRFLNDKELGHNLIKRLGNKFISIFISKILLRCKEIYDVQSGYRILNKKLAKFLIHNLSEGYTYTQEMFILSKINNFKISQTPVKFSKRTSGKSRLIKNPFIYLYKIMWLTLIAFILSKIKLMKR